LSGGGGADAPARDGAWATLVRGVRLSPELRTGLPLTLVLALLATAGRVVVPLAIQRIVDDGLGGAAAELDRGALARAAGLALGAIALTAVAGSLMNRRLARVAETALSNLRVRAFRHLHDLSALHLAAEQRGALVARVTADVDTISVFMQWGGIWLLVNSAQLVLAVVVMALSSWQLTLVVLVTFVPLLFLLRWFAGLLERAYDRVRVRVAAMLGALSESVVGAEVIRAYGAEDRTRERVDATIDGAYRASFTAARTGSMMFASGEVFASLATAGVVALGVVLGVGGDLTLGQLLSFLFLVNLFVAPVQLVTEVLDQAQTAVAGWRRVLDLLEERPDVPDPGPAGVDLPAGPVGVRFEAVTFAYPPRAGEQGAVRLALDGVDLAIAPRTRVAIVGATGSGKTTFARLLVRLTDPTSGRVCLNGVDLRRVRTASLRRAVVLVPQDGFLFDATVEENVRYGRPGATGAQIAAAFDALGLGDWARGLPRGLGTAVGERGRHLSSGERQLVSLARAFVADPALLVLDEATSAVDPGTEARLSRALEQVTAGRTSVTIAHRLSPAAAADEVLVFDRGRLVQRGTHDRLVREPGPYRGLYASWTANAA
jgi:putative ABC transport system ATP-binding protein